MNLMNTSNQFNQVPLINAIILNGHSNYREWRKEAVRYFKLNGVYEWLERNDPSDNTSSESKGGSTDAEYNKITLLYFMNTIEKRLMNRVDVNEGNAKDIWSNIKNKFDISDFNTANVNVRKMIGMRYEYQMSLEEFLSLMVDLHTSITKTLKIDEGILKYTMIKSLPQVYHPYLSDIESSIEMLGVDKLISTILERTQTSSIGGIDKAKIAKFGPSKQVTKANESTLITKETPTHTIQNKENKVCTYSRCPKKKGHTIQECWFKLKDEGRPSPLNKLKGNSRQSYSFKPNNTNNDKRNASFFSEAYDRDIGLATIPHDATCNTIFDHYEHSSLTQINDDKLKHKVFMDTGATSHITFDANAFINGIHEFTKPRKIKLGDNSIVEANHYGDAVFYVNENNAVVKLTLSNCLLANTFGTTLISLSALDTKGFEFRGKNGNLSIINQNNEEILSANLDKNLNLYSLDIIHKNVPHKINKTKDKMLLTQQEVENTNKEENIQAANKVYNKLSMEVWHRRLSHIPTNIIKILAKKAYGINLKDDTINCELCESTNAVAAPHHSKDITTQRPLDLIHMDTASLINTTDGFKGFLTIVDDFSRYLVTIPIKSKTEVFNQFYNWVKHVETKYDLKLKAIRSDNGTEFANKDFKCFCSKYGIEQQFTIRYNPPSNGVAERANRTSITRTRKILQSCTMSPTFWPLALQYATYIHNRIPNKAINFDLPFTLFTGRIPTIKHIRPFGTRAYALIPKELRNKLDSPTEQGIFVGYPTSRKGYMIYYPTTKRILAAREVIFKENDKNDDLLNVLKINYDILDNNINVNHDYKFNNEDLTNLKDDNDSNYNELKDQYEQNYDDYSTAGNEGITSFSTYIPAISHIENTTLSQKTNAVTIHDPTNDENSDADNYNKNSQQLLTLDRNNHQSYFNHSNEEDINHLDFSGLPTNILIADAVEEIDQQTPTSYTEAMKSPERERWTEAMDKEIQSHRDNRTWSLTMKPKNHNVVGTKWVFKRKFDDKGRKNIYKARLVAQGFNQIQGIDYDQTFSPVVKWSSLKFILAYAGAYNLEVEQMDVNTAYLNGKLDETIYMQQPTGYTDSRNQGKVCRLNKSIYGLKQSGRVWYNTLKKILEDSGFIQSLADPCIHYSDSRRCIIAIYVDDLVIISPYKSRINSIKLELKNSFSMKDLGPIKSILGANINRDENGSISIKQTNYINTLKTKYGSELPTKRYDTPVPEQFIKTLNALPENATSIDSKTFRQLIGSLIYLSIVSRPDITYAINALAQYAENPRMMHYQLALRILNYVIKTANANFITYKNFTINQEDNVKSPTVIAYSDASFAPSNSNRKSITGYIIFFNNSPISWVSKKQSIIADSVPYAEFIAIHTTIKEATFLNKLANSLNIKIDPITIRSDSRTSIITASEDITTSANKHYETYLLGVREIIKRGYIKLEYVNTLNNYSDMLTKPQSLKQYSSMISKMFDAQINK